jgi:hypothetical protein
MHVLSLCIDSEHIPFYRVEAEKCTTRRRTRKKAATASGKDAKARLLVGEPRPKGKRKAVSKGGPTERSKRRKTSPQEEEADARSGESTDDDLVKTKSGRDGPRTAKRAVTSDEEWESDGEQSQISKKTKKSKKDKKDKKKKKKKDKKDKKKSAGEETDKKVEKGTRSTKGQLSRGQPVRAERGRRASDVGADVHDWAGYSPTEVAVQKKREAALDLTPAIAKLTSVLGMWRRCEHAECRRWPRPLPQPPVQCCFCKKVRNNNPLLMLATNTVSILFPTDCHTAQMLF